MNKHKAIIPFLVFAAIAAGLWMLVEFVHLSLPIAPINVPLLSRWAAIAAFIYFAVKRKSLTVWIITGMLIGIEAGHDWPAAAPNLQVLSTIFLHLVKVVKSTAM